jgi:hypothetical protein
LAVPQGARDLLATLLDRCVLKRKKGGQPTPIFERSEKQRLLEAVVLVRDMERGVAGTFEDFAKDLPPSPREPMRKMSRREAIESVSRLTDISEDRLGEAVGGRLGFLRKKPPAG